MSTTAVSVGQLQKAGNPQSAVIAAAAALPKSNETAAGVLAAQAKAIVESRYLVAFNRPRDVETVRQKILSECKRPGFAKAARYNKPIGKGIKGPSIRFAEVAIRCMTNIVVETAAIYDDREQRIVRVSVTDLESNVPYSQDVTVRKAVERRFPKEGDVVLRERLNAEGKKVFLIEATDDEILNSQNALISKAIRTLGLRLVPGDIVDEAMDMCVRIQSDEDAKDPNAAKRQILDGFMSMGVTAEQVREFVGHDLANLQPKELQDLRGLYAALRDGETTWREIMDSRDKNPAPATDTPQQPEKPAEQQQATQTQTIVPVEQQPSNPPDDSNAMTAEEVITKINAAKTLEQIDDAISVIAAVQHAEDRDAIRSLANNKRTRILERTTTAKPVEPVKPQTPSTPRRARNFE